MFRTSNNAASAPRPFLRLFCLVAPLVLLATACEEATDVVIEVGTAVMVVNDPDLVPQGIPDADLRIQAAEWTIDTATLKLENDSMPRDMKFEAECKFIDTAVNVAVSDNKCARGIVLGVGDGSPVGAQLRLAFTMQMRRGKPKRLVPTEDTDGDEIPNAADKCPYVTDNQEDLNQNGIGDACEVNGVSDTDGDGFRDGTDNCLWDTNPGQEDTGIGANGIPDAIGDACTEQVATVRDLAGSETIDVTLDAGKIADLDTAVAFLVVDFRSRDSIKCDWGAGECRLDTTRIKACVTTGATRCI